MKQIKQSLFSKSFIISLRYSICFILLSTIVKSQEFTPTINTLCLNGFMSITIRTREPYSGIAFARGHQDACFSRGNNGTVTALYIPLTANDQCGITYDADKEQYFVIVNVRQHPTIIIQGDKAFNISCPPRSQELIQPNANTTIPIQMGFYKSSGQKVHQTVFGKNYTIRLSSLNEREFVVTSCMGFAGYNYSLQLSGYMGCSLNTNLITHFRYDPGRYVAEALLRSMFKFPRHSMIHIQCSVVYCDQNKCPKTDCERRRDDPTDATFAALRSEKRQRLNQPRIGALEGPENYASTTVGVVDIDNATEIIKMPNCGTSFSILVALCIIFGLLLLTSIILNIMFCAFTGQPCATHVPETVEYLTSDGKTVGPFNNSMARSIPTILWYPYNSSKVHPTSSNNRYRYKTDGTSPGSGHTVGSASSQQQLLTVRKAPVMTDSSTKKI